MKMLLRLAALAVAVTGLGAVAIPAASADTGTLTLAVFADAPQGTWFMNVSSGDLVTVSASGTAEYGYEGAAGCPGYPTTYPDGSRYLGSYSCGPKDDPNAALSGAPIGLLIGRIGTGPWFPVGANASFIVNVPGILELAYNDSLYQDNTGAYSVTATDEGGGSDSGGGGGGGGGGRGCLNACRL